MKEEKIEAFLEQIDLVLAKGGKLIMRGGSYYPTNAIHEAISLY